MTEGDSPSTRNDGIAIYGTGKDFMRGVCEELE